MKYHEMTKNYIFRELKCALSIEEAANLCFKSVRTVKEWDKGKTIPPECKRLMRLHSRLELHHSDEWELFKMQSGKLVIPTGQSISAQQLLTGIALLEIQSELELKTNRKLLKLAIAISSIKNQNPKR
ncbi:MAG: regulator [Vibrio sp.]